MKAPTGLLPPPNALLFPPPLPSYQRVKLPDRDPRDTSKPIDRLPPLLTALMREQQGPRKLPQERARPGHSNRKAGARASCASPTANAKYLKEGNFC